MNRKLPNWLKNSKYSKSFSVTVLLLFTLTGFFFFQKLLEIKTHYSLEQFQPKNHTLITQDQKIRDLFKLRALTPYVVLLESKNKSTWLDFRSLNELSAITKRVAKMDEVVDIKSLANIETAITDDQSFTVGPLKDLARDPANHQKILNDPLLAPHIVSSDGKFAALVVSTNRLSFVQQGQFLKKLENRIGKNPKIYEAKISGPTAISNQIATLLQSEILKCSALSLLVSILAFFIIFRNFSVIPLGIVLVVSGNVISIGALSILGHSLNMLSSTLPIIITLMVVAISTQTLSRLGEFKNKVLHRHRHIIVFRVIKELVGSHFLASAAAATGFAALMSSDTPIIRDYGLSVALSVMMTCVVTVFLLAAFSVWLPIPRRRKFPLKSEFAAQFITRHAHALFVGIVTASLLFAFMGRNLNWSPRLFDDLAEKQEIRKSIMTVQEKMGGTIPLEISIGRKGATDTWKNAENTKKLDELVTTWRKKPGVGSVMALTDFLKATNTERRIASTQQALSETYFVFAMAAENPLETFITTDGSHTRVSMRLDDVPALQMRAMISEFKEQAKKEFPAFDIETGGMASTVHPINENLSQELIFGFGTALAWILVMLLAVFRSVRWVVISAIPNLVPPALLLGTLAISATPIKPSIAIIFAISLGLAFNNTVYVLLKLKKMLKSEPSGKLPVLEMMREELGPCFVTSCAVMAGFSVFLFSQFAMNQIFGSFMILSVVAGLLGDLVLLPTLLYIFPDFLLGRRESATLEGHSQVGIDFMTPNTQKYIAGLLIIIGLGLISQKTFAATPNAQDILTKMGKTNMTPYEQVEIKMKIQESDGSTKERTLSIKKKSDGENKAMVRLLSPSDLKGVSLLTVSKGKGDENQWLYLPSEKKSRRIVGSNKKGRFLDSELNYEDLSPSTYANFNNKVVETKGNVSVIESTAKPDSESSYSKIKTWINTDDYKLVKSEYYGEDGKLLKVMTFNGYKKYKNLWRAGNISVKNVKKNRSTILEMKKFSMKKLDDGEFSMSALEEG